MIAVVDYGLGNLRSVSKALESLGARVEVTSDPAKIRKAKAIVLPGVGAFYKGMENIGALGIAETIKVSAKEGKPFLGICLGLQLLFSESEEHGVNKGLDIIRGKVTKFKGDIKVPHMGWNQVKLKAQSSKLKVFEGIPDESYFYFVHSFYVEPEDKNVIAGTTVYGREFVSAVNKDNVWGVQFHPEKSSEIGLKVLENFIRYAG